jgi:hypothetical protein
MRITILVAVAALGHLLIMMLRRAVAVAVECGFDELSAALISA